MTLHIYTARIAYGGPDALDITRGTAEKARKAGLPRPPGEFLAPSARLVFPTLRRLRAARTEEQREAVWLAYEASFFAEMERSWAARRGEWHALLRQTRVVCLCFCINPSRCHRSLVAEELAEHGAVNHGELTDPRPPCIVCDPDGGACECGFRRPGEGPPPAEAQIDREVNFSAGDERLHVSREGQGEAPRSLTSAAPLTGKERR